MYLFIYDILSFLLPDKTHNIFLLCICLSHTLQIRQFINFLFALWSVCQFLVLLNITIWVRFVEVLKEMKPRVF